MVRLLPGFLALLAFAGEQGCDLLVMAGWTVLRFTWRMLTEDPAYVVWATREALAVADGRAPLASRIWRDTP